MFAYEWPLPCPRVPAPTHVLSRPGHVPRVDDHCTDPAKDAISLAQSAGHNQFSQQSRDDKEKD